MDLIATLAFLSTGSDSTDFLMTPCITVTQPQTYGMTCSGLPGRQLCSLSVFHCSRYLSSHTGLSVKMFHGLRQATPSFADRSHFPYRYINAIVGVSLVLCARPHVLSLAATRCSGDTQYDLVSCCLCRCQVSGVDANMMPTMDCFPKSEQVLRLGCHRSSENFCVGL